MTRSNKVDIKKTAIMRFFRGNLFFVALILVLFGLAFTPLRYISFATCVVLWGLYWPFGQKINSIILRAALAFVLVTCLQELIAALFWALRVEVTVPATVAIELTIVLWIKLRIKRAAKIKLVTTADVVSLIVALGSAAVLVAGALHGGKLLPQLIRQITTGYDGTNHLSLVLSDYDHGGYVYGAGNVVKQEIIYPKLSSYPQGWALTTSLWWRSIDSNLNIRVQPTKVLAFFYVAILFWYVVCVYLFNRLILYLAKIMRRKPLNVVEYVGSISLTLFVELLGLIGVVYNNFASFLPALVLPIAMTILVVNFFEEPKHKKQPGVFLISGLLIGGGLSFSWLLAAPMIYLATLLGLSVYFNGELIICLKWLVSKPLTALTSIVLLLLGCLQGWVQLRYGSGDLINETGGTIPIYAQVMFPLLLLVLVVLFTKKSRVVSSAFTVISSGIFLTAGSVYFYQIASAGHASYYSAKIALIACIVIMAFAGASILAILSDWATNRREYVPGIFFAASLVFFLPVAAGVDLSSTPGIAIGSVNYALGQRFLSEKTAAYLSKLIVKKQIINGNFVLYKGYNRLEDVTTTHFIDMLSRQPHPGCEQNIEYQEHYHWSLSSGLIASCAGGSKFYIIASKNNFVAVTNYFHRYPNVVILNDN